MPKTIVLDLSDIEKRKKRVDPDWLQRVQYDETGETILYLSGSKGQRYRVKVWKDEGGNYIGSCTCPWVGRQEEGSLAVPCKHICSVLLMEDPANLAAYKANVSSPEVSQGAASTPADTPGPQETPKNATPDGKASEPVGEKAEEEVIVDPPIIPRWNPENTVTIWPSSVPMLEACNASRVITSEDILIDRVGTPALLGRAAHELCESLVKNDWKFPAQDEVFSIAVKNHVTDEAESLKFLGIFAAQAWHGNEHFEGVKKWFFTPSVEEKIKWEFKFSHQFKKDKRVLIKVSGRLDVCESFPEEERAVVLDWKSGWKNEEDDYEAQMMMGAALLMSRDKRIKTVTTILVWLRDRQMHNVTYTRDELKAWLNELVKYNIFWDGQTYGPGRACTYCKKMMVCEARRAMLEQTARSLVVSEGDMLITPILDEQGFLIPERAYRAYQHVTILKKAADEFLAQLKQRVADTERMPIPGEENKFMDLVEVQGRETIDALISWPIMRKWLPDDAAIAGCVKVSGSDLKSAISGTAEKGSKGKAIKECWEELTASGALSRGKPSLRLKVVKVDPEAVKKT